MTIDGMVMLSEKDEFVYHEMIAHVAMNSHPNPKRVLIIGGGDGGTAREVLRHPEVEHVDMVEIDQFVVDASKTHFPGVGDWENPKLKIRYEDGIAFVKNVTDPYDVIIIDGSDPVGPAEGLFTKDFYQYCYNALTENGVLTSQTETPWVEKYHGSMKKVTSATQELFDISKLYLAFIPLYPTGMWSLLFASKGINPLGDEALEKSRERCKEFGSKLNYYNPEIHRAAFALPNFVKPLEG
jgi:spermidine synthase